MASAAISNSISPREVAESRVIKIASYLRIGTWILLSVTVLGILMTLVALFLSPTVPNRSPSLEGLVSDGVELIPFLFGTDGYSMQSKLVIAVYLAVIGVFFTYCFMRLHILFDNFRNNRIFIRRNSKLLRGLGYALIVGFFLSSIFNYGFILAIALLDATGQSLANVPDLKLSIGTPEIKSLVTIGTIFLSAWILEIGRDLYSEAELTI